MERLIEKLNPLHTDELDSIHRFLDTDDVRYLQDFWSDEELADAGVIQVDNSYELWGSLDRLDRPDDF